MFCESHVVINAGTTWQPLIVYRQQWLDRRAELQNKPSWKDAPEWAGWMAQDSYGGWWFYRNEPTLTSQVWSGVDRYFSKSGGVIGDWRDTLEMRPEEFKPSIEEANRLAQEFKPFTSIEGNQEKEMKQDNGWFERGELPPVGAVCKWVGNWGDGEYRDCLDTGIEVEIIAHYSPLSDGGLVAVFAYETREPIGRITDQSIAKCFIPIRTERDELIGLIKTFRHTLRSDEEVADSILAAGFKLEAK